MPRPKVGKQPIIAAKEMPDDVLPHLASGLSNLCGDLSKLGRHALFEVCDAKQIHRLVTDQPPAGPLAEALRAAGVEILTAETPVREIARRA